MQDFSPKKVGGTKKQVVRLKIGPTNLAKLQAIGCEIDQSYLVSNAIRTLSNKRHGAPRNRTRNREENAQN